MTMPMNVVLVRHGESEGNVATTASKGGDHRYYTDDFRNRHNSSWRLTDKGRQEARIAGEWIREHIGSKFYRYYTSEYLRAMETAALLGLPSAAWSCEFYLRERDWGEMDTASREERKTKFAETMRRRELDSFFWAPPSGESMAQLCLRVDRILNTLHRECEDKNVIIVCHGEVMWCFRVRLERMSQRRFRQLDASRNPHDRIHNCQILHYTRQCPETGKKAPYLNWMRSVCPTDLNLSSNEWEGISRSRYSNEQLFEIAMLTPRLIN